MQNKSHMIMQAIALSFLLSMVSIITATVVVQSYATVKRQFIDRQLSLNYGKGDPNMNRFICATGKDRRPMTCSLGGLIRDYASDVRFFTMMWLIFSMAVPSVALSHVLFITLLSLFVYKKMKILSLEQKLFAKFLGKMYISTSGIYMLVWPFFVKIIF
jgi:hypothetical protein